MLTLRASSQRPVEWILWSPSTQTALVIIPEEVELLIPELRRAADKPTVYLMAYATPVTRAMLVFDGFRYYTLPRLSANFLLPEWFCLELGILSGRLYFDLANWDRVAGYLGSPSEMAKAGGAEQDARPEPARSETGLADFADDPIAFLTEWLSLHRKARDIQHTPMGYILTGRRVGENHPWKQGRMTNGDV